MYKIYPLFGIPEMWTILKPRECKVEGVSNLSVKLSVERELSHFGGELQSEKIPAVISIPKIWTILKSREFEFGGVSLLSKNTPHFWSSAILSTIQTAGILK